MKVLKKTGIGILSVFVIIIVLALIFGDSETETKKSNPTTENNTAETQTDSKSKESEKIKQENTEEEFKVEHDEEYLATREKIWKFLLDKGYEVETTVGVPNIGKTNAKLDEGFEGWYAFINQNEESTEFSVILFNGEVTGIQPVKK